MSGGYDAGGSLCRVPRMVAPSVVVAELMVAGTHRRRGVGRRLLHAYMAGSPAGWLVTHRQGDAPAFYRRLGWRAEAEFELAGEPLLLFTWAAPECAVEDRGPASPAAGGRRRPAIGQPQ